MEIGQVKYNLGKPVRLSLPRHYVDGEYLLTGCILRKKSTGEFFYQPMSAPYSPENYQAELTDMASGSLVIASLGDVSAIGSPTVGGRS